MRKASHHGKGVINTEEIFPVGDTIEFGKTYFVPVSKITPNKSQPRQSFPDKERKELAAQVKSMRDEGGGWGKSGLLQPISVRLMPGKEGEYEIIAGERRWQTFVDNGWKEIPATIYDTNSKEALIATVVENEQRLDLTPSERGMAYLALVNSGMTRREVAERVGRSFQATSKFISLVDAPKDIRQLVDKSPKYINNVATMKRLPATSRKNLIEKAQSGAKYDDIIQSANKIIERQTLVAHQKAEEKQVEKKLEAYKPPAYDPMAAINSIDRQLDIVRQELVNNPFPKSYWSNRLLPGLKKLEQRLDDIRNLRDIDK